jgi:aspartate aminotransferase
MSISQLARAIPQSPTLKLNEKATLLRDQGQAVIHLGGGEPKIKTPIDAILAASAKLSTAEVKYTPTDGIPQLKKAIIRYTEENYGKVIGPENVLVSPGAKAALYAAFVTCLNPQDEVIVLAPYWVSYPEMIRMVYANPVIVRPEDGRFEPKMSDITNAVTSYTKMIIVNSPNNPSGVVYSDELIKELVEYCEKKGLWLVMDDIYHKLVFDGRKAPSAYKFAKDHSENSKLIVINGISKLYGMTGFRIGWATAPKKVIEVMSNVQGQTVSCPSALLQSAAVGALTGMQSVVESLNLTLQNQRNIMVKELKSFDGVYVNPPGGTFYCLPDFSKFNRDSVALSSMLLEKALVVTVPGKEFGMEGHLRLSYCGTIKDITVGLQRIKWALDPNSPKEIFIGDRKLVRDWK